MKKLLMILLTATILLSALSALAEEGTCTITLHYGLEGYADETITVQPGTKMNKALQNGVFQQVSRYPYGLDFDTWYMDPDFSQPINKQDKITADLDLYAGWTSWDADRKVLMDTWLEEMALCKPLFNAMPAFTEDSFAPFMEKLFKSWGAVNGVSEQRIAEMRSLREGLVPICPVEDVVWEIWGEQIPQEDASGYDFYLHQDNPDFRPVLTVFMLPDQTQVKGNIIIASGGARTYRGNDGEGYATAVHMNALGYNCFVLQYRLLPWDAIDSYLDMQRAIRYIRFHAEDKGIGAIDNIATIGYSAGSGIVLGQVAQCYGSITPDVFYPDYIPDEIDRVNSDVKVMAPIYGPWEERAQAVLDSGNPNIPAMFAAVGSKDGLCEGVTKGFLMLSAVTPSEFHVYEGVGHGFGMADHYAGADQMPQQFDAFLMVHFGLAERNLH